MDSLVIESGVEQSSVAAVSEQLLWERSTAPADCMARCCSFTKTGSLQISALLAVNQPKNSLAKPLGNNILVVL